MLLQRSWPTIERRATGGKSGVKTAAGETAAGRLTEFANAVMIELVWPRVNSGDGAPGKPLFLKGLKALFLRDVALK